MASSEQVVIAIRYALAAPFIALAIWNFWGYLRYVGSFLRLQPNARRPTLGLAALGGFMGLLLLPYPSLREYYSKPIVTELYLLLFSLFLRSWYFKGARKKRKKDSLRSIIRRKPQPLAWHTPAHDGRTGATPVVLLHGFLGAGGDWTFLTERLGDGCRCFCPDLPGHGRAPMRPELANSDFSTTAAALLSAMDAASLEKCALVGYSMGGRLALYLALEHPDRFTHLVLESASPGLKTAEEQVHRTAHDEAIATRLEQIADQGDAAAFRQFLEEWYRQPVFESLRNRPELLAELIARRLKNHPRGLAASLRACGTGQQPMLWDALPRLTVPTRAIVGTLDPKYCLIAQEMSVCCPGMTVHEFADCGHNVHLENPDGYTTLIRTFLAAPVQISPTV